MNITIDLHIHSSSCSDGGMTLDEIFGEASRRGIQVLSVTDHDSIDCQESAKLLAGRWASPISSGWS